MDNKSNSAGNTDMMHSQGNVPERQGLSPQESTKMKKCPFCAELIQPEAIKCRYCGEFLYGFQRTDIKPKSGKWYYSTPATIVFILLVGPLALPVVWMNPKFKLHTKIIITVLIIILTIVLIEETIFIYKRIFDQLKQLDSI